MYDYRIKIRNRLLVCIGLFLFLLAFVGGMFLVDRYVQKQKRLECDTVTQWNFNGMVSKICTKLDQSKQPAVKLVTELQKDTTFNFRDEEKVFTTLEQLLQDNPILSGAIMGFEDWVYPQYADHYGFGPLVRRNDSTLVRIQVGELRDFRTENEWYQRQRKEPVSEWSKPFLSDDCVMIATYTMPLFENGRYMGGVGIDINLSTFANYIDSLRPYPSSIITIVDSDLNILIHPNRSYIGTTKLPEAMQRVGIDPDSHPMYHSQDRQGGVDYDYLGQHRMAFYYAPIAETNWMVLLYCNTDEIYAPMENAHSIILIIIVVGGLFILALFSINVFRFIREYKQYKMY